MNILVTGAGSGLGLEVTKKHLERGDQVYALEYQLSEQLLELDEAYSTLTVKQCDLGSTQQVNAAMTDLSESKRTLDILYNIAGIFFESDRVPLEETDIERCMLLYNVNALGPLRVMANAAPLLTSGSVVMNVTSESGSVHDCTRASEYGYGMSKAAFNIASKLFQNQTASLGVRVFCYHPGWMKTAMGGQGAQESPDSLTPQEAADAIMDITLHPESIPGDIMYLDYKKNPLPW